jgi:hypothetical protein
MDVGWEEAPDDVASTLELVPAMEPDGNGWKH